MVSGLIARSAPAFLASASGANASAGLLVSSAAGRAFPPPDASVAACAPRALARARALAPDAAALRYRVDFGGPRARHCAPAGAGAAYTPALAATGTTWVSAWGAAQGNDALWFKDCVAGAHLVSYTLASAPGTSTYAWAWFGALDTSALAPAAPGRWLDSQVITQVGRPGTAGHCCGGKSGRGRRCAH